MVYDTLLVIFVHVAYWVAHGSLAGPATCCVRDSVAAGSEIGFSRTRNCSCREVRCVSRSAPWFAPQGNRSTFHIGSPGGCGLPPAMQQLLNRWGPYLSSTDPSTRERERERPGPLVGKQRAWRALLHLTFGQCLQPVASALPPAMQQLATH